MVHTYVHLSVQPLPVLLLLLLLLLNRKLWTNWRTLITPFDKVQVQHF